MLALLRYTESPIGEYSELFYVPGSFVNPFCSGKALSSIYRIWVDSKFSQHAGRNIWGIPKVRPNVMSELTAAKLAAGGM
jgi:hypothetical protein